MLFLASWIMPLLLYVGIRIYRLFYMLSLPPFIVILIFFFPVTGSGQGEFNANFVILIYCKYTLSYIYLTLLVKFIKWVWKLAI